MSAHSMDQVWAPVAAMQRAAVEAATFGHLAPSPQRTYDCRIVFALGEYGDTIPISVRTPGLPDSPWFFTDMMDYLLGRKLGDGGVYEFVGTYRKCKTGRAIFKGRIATRLTPPASDN